MRVMGIDPGSLCTGYGIVEEAGGGLIPVHFGSIKSKSKTPFAHRLKTIYDGLIAVLEDYRPDAVAVEEMFFAANAKSAIKLGQTRGVALLAAVNTDIALAEYGVGVDRQGLEGNVGRGDQRHLHRPGRRTGPARPGQIGGRDGGLVDADEQL